MGGDSVSNPNCVGMSLTGLSIVGQGARWVLITCEIQQRGARGAQLQARHSGKLERMGSMRSFLSTLMAEWLGRSSW